MAGAIMGICVAIYVLYPEYWKAVGCWLKKAAMFPLGMCAGYLAKQKIGHRFGQPGVVIPAMLFVSCLTFLFVPFIHEYTRALFGLFAFPVVFAWLDRRDSTCWIIKVLRWCGTYSLELFTLQTMAWATLSRLFGKCEVWEMLLTCVFALVMCRPISRIVR